MESTSLSSELVLVLRYSYLLILTASQVESTALSSELLATAMIQLCLKKGDRRPILSNPALGDVLVLYLLEEEAGYAIVGENLGYFPIRVEVDASENTSGFVSSRGAMFCQVPATP